MLTCMPLLVALCQPDDFICSATQREAYGPALRSLLGPAISTPLLCGHLQLHMRQLAACHLHSSAAARLWCHAPCLPLSAFMAPSSSYRMAHATWDMQRGPCSGCPSTHNQPRRFPAVQQQREHIISGLQSLRTRGCSDWRIQYRQQHLCLKASPIIGSMPLRLSQRTRKPRTCVAEMAPAYVSWCSTLL